MSDYPKFPRIPRLHRDVTITEKIDGTNGLIQIQEMPWGASASLQVPDGVEVVQGFWADLNPETMFPKTESWIRAGSRNRWLSPQSDNFGFAAWVKENCVTLEKDLGPGMHYGEWWGSGIQRGYGLKKFERFFSLFNVKRWEGASFETPNLAVVPTIITQNAIALTDIVSYSMTRLAVHGSLAAPGFMTPEGIVIFHHALNGYFKVTLEDDDMPKSVAKRIHMESQADVGLAA